MKKDNITCSVKDPLEGMLLPAPAQQFPGPARPCRREEEEEDDFVRHVDLKKKGKTISSDLSTTKKEKTILSGMST